MAERWLRGPIGLDAELRVTRAGCKTVLVVIPTMAAGTRLRDLLPLVSGDHRVQTMFTVVDSADDGTAEFAAAGGGLVLPWRQAVSHRFDLVLAASPVGLEQVRGQILVVPHGVGSLMSRLRSRRAGPSGLPFAGLARETLTHRGRLIPATLALTHDVEMRALRRSCPEALPVAVVAGDICYDRMAASVSLRDEYRRALGVSDQERLVTVSSTWSSESMFGQHSELCQRLLAESTGTNQRVALVLHPSAWAAHGRWQVTAWLSDCVANGLLLIPPEEGWRATMIASDHVIGDHGSTTQYAAALGKRVTLGTFPSDNIRCGSVADRLAKVAPVLDLDRDLLPQLDNAKPRGRHFAKFVTSRPGQTAAILRSAMYRLLRLPEPAAPAQVLPVPSPEPVRPCRLNWPT
ncbi:hypothetical protein [Actinocrispum wychmicini]|uniref:CDP-glycerol:poly(Glycerophosphate) glycerophosphotransferase n=1 Tax=Actinocrispum wychmicini TaxID=1213861 RepID=A0A4R2IZQ4_9PSEU|nr:hypothetical protein [Actinocrispum wychmicini]TCO50877.1 hypothetical protein EV192_113258 [Actinocrispum wychmicini]